MTYRRLQVYFFLAIFALSLVLLFLVFRPYLGLMIFAGILAVLLRPVYQRLNAYFRGHAAFAAFSTVFLTMMLVLLPLLFVAGTLATEAVALYNHFLTTVSFDDVAGTLSRVLGPAKAQEIATEASRAVRDVATYVQPFIGNLTANIFAIFSNIFSFVIGFFIVLLGMYYFLKDGRKFTEQLLDLSPLNKEDDSAIIDRVIDAIKAVAGGQFIVALVKGAVGALIFYALGLPTPIFWGAMIALAHFLPGIGTALITAPFIIYLFAVGRLWSGLTLSTVSILAIGLIDNFLAPRLMRTRMQIHPLLILLSMLGGLSFFGAYGLFFGPIVLSVTLALIDIYKKEFRMTVEKID